MITNCRWNLSLVLIIILYQSNFFVIENRKKEMSRWILKGEKMSSMCAQIRAYNGRMNTKSSHLMLPEKEHQTWNVLQSRCQCMCLMPAFVHIFPPFSFVITDQTISVKNIYAVSGDFQS